MDILSQVLWWATFPMLVVLLGFMFRHHSIRSFPWFSAYVFYALLAAVLRFVLLHHRIYPYVYWYTDVGYALVGIAVMYEVFRSVSKKLIPPFWSTAIFPVIVIGTLILTFLRTRAVDTDLNSTMAWFVGIEMCARIVEVAMFLLLLMFVAILGLRWRAHQFGISAGFGIYAAFSLLASTKYYENGSKFISSWALISVVSYTVTVLIWLWYFSNPVEAEAARSDEPPLSLQDLERYKEIARRMPRT